MKYFFYVLILAILFSSCFEDNEETFTISGKFIDGTNPTNKFANLKLTFQDYHNHRNLITLGEATTDANGNFKFSYEYSKAYSSNSLRIFVDSNFVAAKKLNSFELGTNWEKTFYLGDSAIFDLYVNSTIGSNDTLYFSTSDSLYILPGPCAMGFVKRYKAYNYNLGEYVNYGVGYSNYFYKTKISSYSPTGEPVIDKLYLNF